ncbi:MAG: energy-coupled thiamine transporter ThiT [Nitrososphaerota archaeon]|jgi:thiamine transporter|nr:energy-coupled thiamine transporter ThiT [Nitrososphaerota archaeon]
METRKENTLNFKPKNRIRTQILAEIAIFTALGVALSIITFIVFPQGGSITAGTRVPMLWLALRRGPKIGLFAGVVYGFVQLAVFPQVYYPTQVLLDYPLAYGCLGLAGFFKNHPITGVTVAVSGGLVMHFISGVIFFAHLAPAGMNPWVYSGIYNGSYMLPELVISIVFIYILQKSKVLRVYM